MLYCMHIKNKIEHDETFKKLVCFGYNEKVKPLIINQNLIFSFVLFAAERYLCFTNDKLYPFYTTFFLVFVYSILLFTVNYSVLF